MLTSLLATLTAANVFVPTVTFEARPSPTAAPTMQVGVLSEPLTGELSSAVRAWALTHGAPLGLNPASTLKFEVAFATRFGASFHFVQQVRGVDVYQAKLVITVDQQARVVQVASSLASFSRVREDTLLSEAQALERAARLVPFPALRPQDPSKPYGGDRAVFFAVDGELHAGFVVNVITFDASKNWYLGFDAVTGETIFTQNRVHHAADDANAYAVSPGGLDAGVGATPTTVVSLTHADGGSYVGTTCELFLPDGGFAVVDNDAGVLCGDQLTSYNCCTRKGCSPDAGSARVVGPTTVMGFSINIDLAVCDRVNQATSQREEANLRYTPVDPPRNRAAVELDDPANSDTFAHVHSFYHVNRVYDWVRGLSTRATPLFPGNQPAIGPFRMRDERRTPARKPAVLSNVLIPDFQSIMGIPACLGGSVPCVSNNFSRVDNAAFLPAENFGQLPLPGLSTGVDTLVIFQGNAADAAYDATVLWHEFGHGVVYATAALTFDDTAIDNRSANNEGGALHEGFADYIAGAFGRLPEVGPYFGPRAIGASGAMGLRQDGYLRSLGNSLSCPDVLWGQVHQDSQHVSAALWAGRQANLGTDNGATYDAAFYAMLVSLAPNADFAAVATAMSARVTTALGAAAGTALRQVFDSRGVTNCSKVLEVTPSTAPRPAFSVPQVASLRNSIIPGPFQFKLRATDGAFRVRVQAQQQGGGGPFGGGGAPPPVTVMIKTGSAITFTRNAGALANDADFTTQGTAANGTLDVKAEVRVPCAPNQEIYVAIGSSGGASLQNLTVTADPLVNCLFPAADGGTPADAGTPAVVDAGTDGGSSGDGETRRFAAAGIVAQPAAKVGCGCTSLEGGSTLAVLGLLSLVRRRSGRHPRNGGSS